MKLTIEYDHDTESPIENGAWELHSFNRCHRNFAHPEKFLPPDIGLRRKLNCGTAFLLAYYEHGLCNWSLSGEGPQCRWDSVQCAGVLIYKDPIKYLPKTYQERANMARSFLEEYTTWCNGECYWYRIEEEIMCNECGNVKENTEIDSCGGFIGMEWLAEHLKAEHPELFEKDAGTKINGEAGYIFEHIA